MLEHSLISLSEYEQFIVHFVFIYYLKNDQPLNSIELYWRINCQTTNLNEAKRAIKHQLVIKWFPFVGSKIWIRWTLLIDVVNKSIYYLLISKKMKKWRLIFKWRT